MGALVRWSAPFTDSDGGTRVSLTDPLGNAVWEDRRGWTVSGNQETAYHTVTRWEYTSRTGRLLAKIVTDAQSRAVRSIERNWYDASGNREEWGSSAPLGQNETMHERTRAYYGADERLRVVDRQRCMTKVVGGVPVCAGWNHQRNAEKGAFEEYRYDALGRRILVRRRLAIVNDTELTEACAGCWNTVDRIVWDGDDILWEVRANGATAPESDNAVGPHLGQVGYTHALGMDQPVSILRRGYSSLAPFTLIPHADYRGVLAAAHYPSGRAVESALDVRSLPWAGANNDAYMAKLIPSQPDKWIGSLAENLADASGQLYRRNRYYDPQSGRFTQEDPIGLAGGLNLYGFGGGDPLGFTDPYGLCPFPQKGQAKQSASVKDCKGRSGKILRLLSQYGDARGGEMLRYVFAKNLQLYFAESQADLDRVGRVFNRRAGGSAFYDLESRKAFLLASSVGGAVARAVHEVGHGMLGGGIANYGTEEPIVKIWGIEIYGRLPEKLRDDPDYSYSHMLFSRDPVGYLEGLRLDACAIQLANSGRSCQ